MADIEKFEDFGLDPLINVAIKEAGYTVPTPIQIKAIPLVLQGKDVMGAAQTGTGKTAGFGLPLIHRLLPQANTSTSPAKHPVRALILVPTRELAVQLAENLTQYASKTPLRVGLVYGGVDIKSQTEQLRKGVEILIATPGRLLDHLEQRNTSLNNVEVLILDEADRMLDMGFLPDIITILQKVPEKRQNLMFSATFSPEIKRLAKQFLNNPEIVEVARQNTTATGIKQEVFLIHQSQKTDALVEILRKNDSEAKGEKQQAIIFVNAKITARRLASQLARLGLSVEAMHGDKTQEERNTILQGFKDKNIQYLVATDVAARGLDIPEIPFVFNYDVPFTPEDYVHRIGRTGRAGAKGTAVTLTTNADERNLKGIERLIKKTFERVKMNPRRVPIPRYSTFQGGTYKPAEPAPLDPFFTQPYVPSGKVSQTKLSPSISPMRRKALGKKPVATLLGGTGKRLQSRNRLRRGL